MNNKEINKYKLKEQYSTKLNAFVDELDNNLKKDIENGSNANR